MHSGEVDGSILPQTSPLSTKVSSLTTLVRITALLKLDGFSRVSFKERRGTHAQARNYCFKGSQPKAEWLELGIEGPNYGKDAVTWENKPFMDKLPGKRSDIHEMYELAKQGCTKQELMEHNPAAYNRCYKMLAQAQAVIPHPQRTSPRDIILVYGPPGIGKTSYVASKYPDRWELPISSAGKWFDGYDGQKVVLIDDYEGSMTLTDILMLLDPWYVRQVPVKGSHVWFDPDTIILTSNTHPSLWYDYNNSERGKERQNKEWALRDRFTRSPGGGMRALSLDKQTMEWIDIDKFWPLKNIMQDTKGYHRDLKREKESTPIPDGHPLKRPIQLLSNETLTPKPPLKKAKTTPSHRDWNGYRTASSSSSDTWEEITNSIK